MRLSDASLARPVTVVVCVLALVLLGAISLSRLPIEFLPNKDFPFIGVYVPYPNAVPSQVEKEITRPIEEVLATLGDVRETFSESEPEYAFIGVQFDFGRNVDVLRMEVKEKLDQVRPLLPEDVKDLFIFTFNTNDIPIMVGRISATGRDLASSYDLLDRHVIQPLERIPGVGRVNVDGVLPADISIYLFLDKILQHNIDVEDVFAKLSTANLNLTLGRVTVDRERYMLRAIGEFNTVDEIENMIVNDSGLRLDDIAAVIYDEPLPSYRRRINGEPAVAFEIQRASGANIVELSRNVHEALEGIRQDPALEGVDVVLFFDQAKQITGSLDGLFKSGLIGSLLALVVLYTFLRRFTTTLVVSAAIPFSIVSACVFLYLSGRSLNVLTMMGLMLATGMLVDNAIVVLESIHRRQQKHDDPMQAARLGTHEVGRAVVAATLTSVCVFAPVVLTPSSELGVWLGEVGYTIIFALLFSLIVSLTLVPLMMGRFVRVSHGRREAYVETEGLPKPLYHARRVYLRALEWAAIKRPFAALGIVLATVVATVVLIKVTNFSPEADSDRGVKQEELSLRVEFIDNVNIYGVERYADRMEEYLLAKKDSLGVESVYTFYTDNFLMSRLYFKAGDVSEDRLTELRELLREELPPLAGAKYRMGEEGGRASGGAKQITVTLFGEDSDYLAELAEEVKRRLRTVEELTEIETDLDRGKEEVQVQLRSHDAGRFGIAPATMAQILNLTFRGVTIGEMKGLEREVPIGIILEPSDRRNIDNLRSMVVSRVDGQDITLDQVADFQMTRSASRIFRENRRTALPIHASYEGEEMNEITKEVASLMSSLDLPEGYAWSFGREMRDAEEEVDEMGMNILLALACVYFVMAALFESIVHPLVIMICIPFAILGVVWTCVLTGTPFNIMAMIGLVILIGVVVNNGIILVDHINLHRREGRSREEAILLGGRERFRPILMTALTTILGLLPLALGRASVGDGYYYPMARAVMGGLAASTILSLLALPTLYVLSERWLLWNRRIVWRALGRFQGGGAARMVDGDSA